MEGHVILFIIIVASIYVFSVYWLIWKQLFKDFERRLKKWLCRCGNEENLEMNGLGNGDGPWNDV